MNFSKYTTKELEFITSNIELLKKVLEKRRIKELNDFPFKVGDVIHSKHDNDNFLLKIKEIYEGHGDIIVDEIVIRDGGLFDYYVDEYFDIDTTDWSGYVKIGDSEIFENLNKIIDEYDNTVQQLGDNAYHNQELLGRIIPNNSPQAIELHRYLGSKNIAIQYHPKHGMVLCDLDKNNM